MRCPNLQPEAIENCGSWNNRISTELIGFIVKRRLFSSVSLGNERVVMGGDYDTSKPAQKDDRSTKQRFCENERTPTPVQVFGMRLHPMGLSLQEIVVGLFYSV